MARILVTGIDGFTGRHLAPLLAAEGHEVHGLVHHALAAGATPDGVHQLHVCDLLDAAALQQLMARLQPSRIAHLAAIAFVAHGDVNAIYQTNLIGARNLLAALAGQGSAVSSVLMASSANVYGNATAGVIDESVPAAPANDYAVSKLAMEYMARTWLDRLPITLVRPFNYTGVGQSDSFLIPKIVRHFRDRAAVLELGNLEIERDFSDVRVVVDCYRRLLESPCPGRTLNVCSGVGYTLQDVLETARGLTGHWPELRVNPAFVRNNEVRKLVGSKLALEAAIGPVPDIALRDTLAWMLAAPGDR